MSARNFSAHPSAHRLLWPGPLFVLLGAAFGIAMSSANATIYAVEGGISGIASILPLGYAFGAGMVATVNPCGVLLLPSLVAFYLGRDPTAVPSGWRRAAQALQLGGMATLGFVALFALVGLIVGVGGRALATAFPIGGLAVGIGLGGLGIWLALTGHELGLPIASRAMQRVRLSNDLRSLFFFGIAYAVTSLACTLPIFLVVVGSALAVGSPLEAASQFVSYAFGMGVVLTAVILGAAYFQSFVSRSVRAVAPIVHRLAAAFLIGAGLFIIHYWLTLGGILG